MQRDLYGAMQRLPYKVRSEHAEEHARCSSNQTEHDRFSEELQLDGLFCRANCNSNTDLACSLRNRNEHDVHDPDSANYKRNGGDGNQKNRQRPARIQLRLNNVFRVPDVKVILFFGSQMMA